MPVCLRERRRRVQRRERAWNEGDKGLKMLRKRKTLRQKARIGRRGETVSKAVSYCEGRNSGGRAREGGMGLRGLQGALKRSEGDRGRRRLKEKNRKTCRKRRDERENKARGKRRC